MSHPVREISVVGAGLVGAIQALLLARAGNTVTVIERRSLHSNNCSTDPLSSRTVALSHRTWELLVAAELWPPIDFCPIKKIHVTEQGKFGSVRMQARDANVEALGYVLANAGFENYLHTLLKAEPGVKVIEGATVVSVHHTERGVDLLIELQGVQQEIYADVLVAADGTGSEIRSMLGIETEQHDYQQCAVIANVSTARPHSFEAFERFTGSGPLALLPVSKDTGNENFYSMIFTADDKDRDELQSIPDEKFLARLQEKFGGRLGRFESIGPRLVVPLKLTVSKKQVEQKCVLIGNASRTLHPVAGQGLNLAMRDAFELTACLGSSDNTDTALSLFTENRRRDQKQVTSQTDMLARLFTDKPWPLRLPLSLASSSSFFLLEFIDPLRKKFADASMGRNVALPR